MFQRAIYQINQANVEEISSMYPYKALVENLVDYSNDNGYSFQGECWYRDTGVLGGGTGVSLTGSN